jgi:hypothetical protein
MATFKVEMKHGQDHRIVEADTFDSDKESGWLIFYRRPPQGGIREYWRARLDSVISFETMR